MKRRKLRDGEWSHKSKRRDDGTWAHRIKCCDCGLEHVIQYALTKKEALRFRAWRLKRGATHR